MSSAEDQTRKKRKPFLTREIVQRIERVLEERKNQKDRRSGQPEIKVSRERRSGADRRC